MRTLFHVPGQSRLSVLVSNVDEGHGMSAVDETAVRFVPVGSSRFPERVVLVGDPAHDDAGVFPPAPITHTAFKSLVQGLA